MNRLTGVRRRRGKLGGSAPVIDKQKWQIPRPTWSLLPLCLRGVLHMSAADAEDWQTQLGSRFTGLRWHVLSWSAVQPGASGSSQRSLNARSAHQSAADDGRHDRVSVDRTSNNTTILLIFISVLAAGKRHSFLQHHYPHSQYEDHPSSLLWRPERWDWKTNKKKWQKKQLEA